MTVPTLHLASLSPRRLELLQQIGVHPNVLKISIDETPKQGESPSEYVLRLAGEKAQAGWAQVHSSNPLPVLAADTSVVIDGEILGKPSSRAEALEMLEKLSGRTHQVLTGVALCQNDVICRLSESRVTFRPLSKSETNAYWESGEPRDKAGSYGIQGIGALFISHLEGSYSGVMGLPIFETTELLKAHGIDPLQPNEAAGGA